jgi:RNA ligase/PHA02142 OB-fold domain
MSDTPFEVVEIKSVEAHPQADHLEVVKVLNTQFISQIGNFHVGDLCIYFPPDMLLSKRWAEALGVANYLKHSVFPGDLEKSKCRIGAIRLRGVASFGFGIPPLAVVGDAVVGDAVTEYFGGVKYQPPEVYNHGNSMRQPAAFHGYTSIQHYYRNASAFVAGAPVRITEKIHGCVVSWQPITMADGSKKRIAQIVVGDEVLGVNSRGQISSATVTKTFKNGKAQKWLGIQATRNNANRGSSSYSVKCTPEHNFWSPDAWKYVSASFLEVGDRVLTYHSNSIGSKYKLTLYDQVITAIEDITDQTQSRRYDIETTTHNYFAGNVLVHNSNSRIGLVRDNGHEFMCGTHHRRVSVESAKGCSSLYAVPLTEDMKDMLAFISCTTDDVIVFGEIYGHKIQKMDYGCVKGYRVFDISVNGQYLDWQDIHTYCEMFNIKTVPVLYAGPFSPELIDEYVNGPTSLADPDQIKCSFKGREGIVITPLEEQHSDVVGGRLILKAVSADYYEKM